MVKVVRSVLCGVLFASALSASAQQQPQPRREEPANVVQYFWMDGQIDKIEQLNEAIRGHSQFRKQQGDPWRWELFELAQGASGRFVAVSAGHRWSELDAYQATEAKLGPDFYARVSGKLLRSRASIATIQTGASRPFDAWKAGDLAMVYTYWIKAGKDRQFLDVLTRFTEAANKVNWPQRYVWLSHSIGAPEPSYFLVLPHHGYADLRTPDKTNRMVLEEAYGRSASDEMFEKVDDAIQRYTRELWAFRADLSVLPEPAKK